MAASRAIAYVVRFELFLFYGLIALLLVTIVHVFVGTAAFILFGAQSPTRSLGGPGSSCAATTGRSSG